MLTFYENSRCILLTNGKVTTKVYHYNSSMYAYLLNEYFKGNVTTIDKVRIAQKPIIVNKTSAAPYYSISFTPISILHIVSNSGLIMDTLRISFKLSPFATTLQLTKKLHPELFI